MSSQTQRASPCLGSRCRLLAAIAVALFASLSIGAAPVHAQPDECKDHEWHGGVHCGGYVEVDTNSLTVDEGGRVSYRIRLSKPPVLTREEMAAGELWVVRLHVDGSTRNNEGTDGYDVDGDGETDFTWSPPYYRRFNLDDWNQWKNISIDAHLDSDGEDQRITFRHEVWDQDTDCPFLGSPVTVRVNDTTNEPVTVSIADATVVDEGETAIFDVRLNKAAGETVTVEYQTANGSARAVSDYVEESGTLTFSPGRQDETIYVRTVNDNIREATETFTVTLRNASGAAIRDGTATGTIDDDDVGTEGTASLTISNATVTEGDTAEFTAALGSNAGQSVTVTYDTVDGTAAAGSDYTDTSGPLTLAPGDTETISVDTIEDTTAEQTETFTVTLTDSSNVVVASATGTINDDDSAPPPPPPPPPLPTLSIDNAEASEGDVVEFTVTVSGTRTGDVAVSYSTADGSATDGDDYAGTSNGTLTFTSSESSKTISVATIEDTDPEDDETFTVTLSSPNGATIDTGAATGTITDDDEPPPTLPTLSIEDAAASEGDAVEFTVTLTGTRTGNVTVAYATADESAEEGSDYSEESGTLTFTPTEEFHTISVPTIEDTDPEENETFTVTLSSPNGATIDTGTATGTINDDDEPPPPPLPTLTFSDTSVEVEEGDSAEFTVTLTGTRTGEVTVAYATADGSADAGDDYDDTSGTLTFDTTEDSKTITVPTIEDTDEEENETFTVTLGSPNGATIEDGTATGTINDDDEPPPTLPTLSIEDAAASEGDAVEFTVTLTGTRTGNVTVAYATADGSAEEGSDYSEESGTLTFTPTEEFHTISVPTIEDTDPEENETFTVTLSSPSGATIDDGTATGTITDDDEPPPPPLPALAIAGATVEEGDTAAFQVTLTGGGARTGNVTVAYATADGSAEEGSDYTLTSGTLTFTPTENSKAILVPTVEDTAEEETETFTVTLSSPTGATVATPTATGTINDDDGERPPPPPLPMLSIEDATAEEGNAAAFEVTLSATSARTVSVAYATADGTAVEDDDYTTVSGTLVFQPGEEMMTISVQTTEDTVEEDTETFTVTLSSPSGATIDDGTATGTITDDDEPVTPPPTLPTLSIADATVEEGGAAAFDVTLSEPSGQTVTVAYATADGTAVEDDDYTAASGTLTFAPGEEMMTISVQTTEDTVEEETEHFIVTLSGPGGATIDDGTATGTITDDDEPPPPSLPALAIAGATVEEGDTAAFQVTLTGGGVRTGNVTVAYATADVSAESGSDYTLTSGTLTFTPTENSKVILVPTVEDTTEEETETFTVTLSSPSGATIATATATGTINDDDREGPPPPPLPTLSIEDATVEEGNAAAFEVTLSATSARTVSVAYATADGSATAGSDYTTASGTLVFQPGENTKAIPVQTTEDDVVEETENFTVTLSRPSGATIDDGTATGTITDDDEPVTPPPTLPALSIADATVEEGGAAAFEVTLSEPSNETVTVAYATADGTAVEDSDYTAADGTLAFAPGEKMMTIFVQTTEDTVEEETEDFAVTLSRPSGATIDDGTATGTITDDDEPVTPPPALPTLSIADATVEEGGAAAFEVTLSEPGDQTVTVAYATADGTAMKDSDYTAASGTLSFAPGEEMMTISVQTTDDDAVEETETFTVTLSSPAGATIDDGTATGTITDDDEPAPLPAVTVADAEVEEGDTAEFWATLDRVSTEAVTVAYATADDTAVAGDDYTDTSGTLEFAPGEAAKRIQVPTLEDDAVEETEAFTVTLSSPAGATIDDGTATGTITDDDEPVVPLPTLSIADDEVEEGDIAEFQVTLSAGSAETVTVGYATADGTAVAGDDYTDTSGTLRFAPGETAKTIQVPTLEDDAVEETEAFTVTLASPAGATIDDGTATGTITDDDEPVVPLPTLSIADDEVEEGGTAEFQVTLSAGSAETVTVGYATADGTAVAGDDYTDTSGTLRFAPGETAKTIRVPTLEDDAVEETETFTVTLSSPAGATIDDGTATGTITDDDEPVVPLPTLSIADDEVEEGGTAEFQVTLSAGSAETVTVGYATADGTAVAGDDYTDTSGTLRFAPGETTKTIRVPTLEDDAVEETETFTVTLASPAGATIDDGTATGTIIDDDEPPPLPSLSISDAEAREGEMAEFLITLRPASNQVVTVAFRTMDGTAVAGLDYTATMGTLRFEPGETTATIAVSTLTDELAEGIERFTMELSDPVGATVSDGIGVGTIADDHTARITTVNRTILPEAGRALAFNAVACRFDRALSNPAAADGRGSLSLPRGLLAGRRTSPAGGWTSPADPRTSPAGPPPSLEQALGSSSFLMPSGDGQGAAGRYTTWGCADYRRIASSGAGALSWSGMAFSAQVGFDMDLGANTLAGVSVSRSRSAFGYYADAGADLGGANELRLTGVHPYVAWSASPDFVVWGTVGHGWGDFQVDDRLGAGMLGGTAAMNTGMVGVNGRLLGRGATVLRLRGEGGVAQLGMAGDMETLEMVDVDMRRLRLAAEASHEHLFSFGSTLTPWAEVGLRHDGGDGETGAGLEVRGGVRYRDVPQGLTIEGYGRRLVVHQGTVRESGFGAVLRVDPGESGLGPSMSLTPAWGATASGVHQLWERGANAFSMYDAPGARMNAQFAYGLPAIRGAGLLTPFGMMSLTREDGRSYGLGATLAVGRTVSLSLEAERRRRLAARAIHAIMLRGMWKF